MTKRTRLTESQLSRRIHNSPRARRANAISGIACVTAIVAAGAFALGLALSWPVVAAGAAGVFALSILGVIVATLSAARAIGIGRWRALRHAIASARDTMCTVAELWLHA